MGLLYEGNIFKRLLFCLVFAAAILICSNQVSAANYYIRWEYIGDENEFIIERNEKINIGDYVKISYGKEYYTGSMVKATYSSSNKKIATVSKKGLVTPKKTGTCDITFRYKGKKLTAHLIVVASGELGLDKEYNYAVSQLKSYASKITIPAKITDSNAQKLFSDLRAYRAGYNLYSVRYLTDDGVAYIKRRINTRVGLKDITSCVAVPTAGRYLTLNALVNRYKYLNDPQTNTNTKKLLKVKKATASGSTINVTLKKAPTASQITAMQIRYSTYNPTGTPATEANILLSVYSSSAKRYLNGWATLKKGSKTFTIELSEKTDRFNKRLSIVKGSTYEFCLSQGTVTTVKAK